MDKKILLKLIKKDIEELDLIASALDESETVNKTLLNLAVSKVKSIQDELLLLSDDALAFSYTIKTKIEEEVEQASEEKPIEEIIEDVIEEQQDELEEIEASIEETIAEKPQPTAKEKALETQLEMAKDEVEEMDKVGVEIATVEEEKTAEDLDVKPEEREETVKPRTLGESFLKEESLNDKMASSKTGESKIKAQSVTNLKAAIGLNDKFQYIRELFDNNADLFNKTIDELNELENIEAAAAYLSEKFKWTKTDISLKFTELLKRKFGV